MNKLYLIFLSICLLTSCFPTQKATIDEDIITLANTKWELVKPKNLDATLLFNDDASSISGFNGCNQYTSEINKKNYQIEFGIFTTTEIYCETKQEIEQEFMKTLSQVNDYILNNDKLYLKRSGSTLLTFKEIKE